VYHEKNNKELSKILQKTVSNFVLKNRQLTFSFIRKQSQQKLQKNYL